MNPVDRIFLNDPRIPTREYAETMNRLVEEAAVKRAELIESFIVKYLVDTGLRIDQVRLCEQFVGTKLMWWLEPCVPVETLPAPDTTVESS